jgi:tetratricopeptide (TPR) repeat protein/predicted Ser/Thr protein kinase
MDTESFHLCPECGKPVPAESPHQLCPACLMAQALASRTLVDGDDADAVPPPLSPEEIAEKFPQFEITECLGRGGMGSVYKARQKSLNRWVAIKILAPEREGRERFAERFAREAQTLARLSHPHIVTIHDFGQTDGLFYLVMEYVDGVNLRELLRDGKIEPAQALTIVPPICDALQYAHDKGVVHRDIKPENLLLDRDGRVKIADFGIASLIGAENESVGTPAYMAPEQADAKREVDHRADIYALGVVLYEMLTGERPAKEVIEPSRKVQIDVRLDEIVLRALDQKPERRYQTAGEFRTVLATVEPSSAVLVPHVMPGPAIETSVPAAKSNRSGKWAFGLLLVAMLVGLTCWDAIDETFLMISVAMVALLASILGAKDWRSRLGKFATVAAALWLTGWLVFTIGFFSPIGSLHRYTHQSLYPRLQIPKGYNGVVVVASSLPGYPELPIRGDKQVLRFPADGVLLTSGTPRFGLNATRTLETYDPATGKIGGGPEITCHFETYGEVTTPDGTHFELRAYEVGDALYWQRKKSPTDAEAIKREAKQRVLDRLRKQNISFGPVIERVVTDIQQNPAQASLDFGSGESGVTGDVTSGLQRAVDRMHLPPWEEANGPDDRLYRWIKDSGMDLIGCTGLSDEPQFKFFGEEPKYMLGEDTFDSIPPSEVMKWLRLPSPDRGMNPNFPSVAVRTMKLSRKWLSDVKFILFRTHDGDVGVMEILGVRENPRGVKIRYKLVQESGASSETKAATSPVVPLIHLKESTLVEALDFLRTKWSLNYTFDPTVTEEWKNAPVLTGRWENLTARQIMTELLDLRGLEWEENPQTGVARIRQKPHGAETSVHRWTPYGQGKPDHSPVVPIIDLKDSTLVEALDFLQTKWPLNYAFDPTITEEWKNAPVLTGRWEKLTALQAMIELLDLRGLQLVVNPRTSVARIIHKPHVSPAAAFPEESQSWDPWAGSIKKGDILRMNGDLAAALEYYQNSLVAAEKTRTEDLRNQRLAESHMKIGDVLCAQNDLAGAMDHYRSSMTARERQAKKSPQDTDVQKQLVWTWVKLGDVQKAQGDLKGALTSYRGGPEGEAFHQQAFETSPSDYKRTEPFKPEELTQLAANPKSHDDFRRLMWLINRAGAEKNASFRFLLDKPDLRKGETDLALTGYDFSVNGNQKALDDLLSKLADEEVGSDSSVVVALSFIDEWDRSIKAVNAHFTATDGAGGMAEAAFWQTRAYLFPRQMLEFQGKAGEGAPLKATAKPRD